PAHRFTNRSRISGIILLSFEVRFYKLGRNQPDLMSERTNHPRPVMRSPSRFQPHHALWDAPKEVRYLASSKPLFQHCSPPCIRPVYLKHVLRTVEPDHLHNHAVVPPPGDYSCFSPGRVHTIRSTPRIRLLGLSPMRIPYQRP